MGVIAEGIPRVCQGLFSPVSLGYPLSVFNKKLYSQNALAQYKLQIPLNSCAFRGHHDGNRFSVPHVKPATARSARFVAHCPIATP